MDGGGTGNGSGLNSAVRGGGGGGDGNGNGVIYVNIVTVSGALTPLLSGGLIGGILVRRGSGGGDFESAINRHGDGGNGTSPSSRDDRRLGPFEKPADGFAVGLVAEFTSQLEDTRRTGSRNSDSPASALDLGVAILGGGSRGGDRRDRFRYLCRELDDLSFVVVVGMLPLGSKGKKVDWRGVGVIDTEMGGRRVVVVVVEFLFVNIGHGRRGRCGGEGRGERGGEERKKWGRGDLRKEKEEIGRRRKSGKEMDPQTRVGPSSVGSKLGMMDLFFFQ